MGKWSTYRRRGSVSTPTAPEPPPLPLDAIATAAWAAYSTTRKLRSAYAGSAFRVRRSSDSTELDIGFTGANAVDTAALTAFVGGSTGTIRVIYDQTGNGRNLSTSLGGTFPTVVNAGTLVTDDSGRPAAGLLTARAGLTYNVGGPAALPVTMVGLAITGSSLVNGRSIFTMGSEEQGAVDTGAATIDLHNGSTLTGPAAAANSRYVITAQFTSGSDLVQLGITTPTTGAAGNSGPSSPGIGAQAFANVGAISRVAEWLIYNSALSGGDMLTLQNNLLAWYD